MKAILELDREEKFFVENALSAYLAEQVRMVNSSGSDSERRMYHKHIYYVVARLLEKLEE